MATSTRAFSLRRSARALVTPAPGHLRPLDGWRALSILWVVTFHVGWFAPAQLPHGAYVALLLAPWMVPIWRGDFGVDVFFVLSGLLIAGLLVDERARTGRVRLGLFYARRAMRLWPALVVAVVVDAVVIGDHPDNLWANLFYVSNFLPVVETAMGWTWSLSIEEQFYLVCPWLIGALAALSGGARSRVFAALLVALSGIAAIVVVAGGFHAADSEIVFNRDLWRWAAAFDALYSKPWMRAGPLVCGVAAAYATRSSTFMAALGRERGAATAGLVVALVVAVTATSWPLFVGTPRGVEVLYLATYRVLFGASVAYAILLSLSSHPLGRAMARVLSARVLYPFAQLAYSAYLLNPIVTQQVHRALSPFVQAGGVRAMAILAPADALATFAAASVVYVAVERPVMELRPRAAE